MGPGQSVDRMRTYFGALADLASNSILPILLLSGVWSAGFVVLGLGRFIDANRRLLSHGQ